MTPPLQRIEKAEISRILEKVGDRSARERIFAALTRINTLYMVARAGSGHLGSSFSATDIVTHLLLSEMRDWRGGTDVYFSSKGHDAPSLYAALIGLGALPEEEVHRLRRIDGLPGHPDTRTPFMPFNTGSLGMGISKAKGMILAARMRGVRRRVYCMTGDGELQEGQNWEALGGAARDRMGELTAIVDRNGLQSDTWVRDVSDLGDLEAKFSAFGWGAIRCDGNDPDSLAEAFRRRWERFPDGPAAIVADTVKGSGCATFAATSMGPDEWRYRFHSGAPSPEDHAAAHAELVAHARELLDAEGLSGDAGLRLTDEAPRSSAPAPAGERLPVVYGKALTRLADEDPRVVALDADLVLDTGLIPFRDAHPERFVECGIAEQDMVSMAGGMAAEGLLPFAHSFSCFLHARPNEQIYNNATEDRRVVYTGSMAGAVPAAPGHSHQAVRDASAVGAVPGLLVLAPVNADETEHAVRFAAATEHSLYLRLSSAPVPRRAAEAPTGPLEPGRGRTVREGDGRTVAIGAGPTVVNELLVAAEDAAAAGAGPTVVNLPWMNRVDADWLESVLADAERVLVVEEHYTRGGQADAVARALAELALHRPPGFRGIGLDRVPECGTPEEVLDAHGLSGGRLASAILPTTNRSM